MKLTFKKNKIITSSIIILALLITSIVLVIFNLTVNDNETVNSENKISPYEKALKFNGEYVDSEYIEKEYITFYEKYKTNATVLKKTDEERNDLFFQEIIEKLILEEFVNENCSSIKESDLNNFVEEYVKSKFEDDKDFEYYLTEKGFKNESELKKTSLIYLKEVKVLPDIAKNYGIELTKEEKNSDKTEDMLITEKFLNSDKLSEWIKTIEKNYTYKITEPSIKAYKLVLEENYSEASKYYLKAYEKYGNEVYKEKAKEFENK